MQKNIKIIAPAAVAVVVAGYFGLGAYASSQAEKDIEDWLYDNNLSGKVRWDSVSSTPFGGTVTLKGVRIEEKNPLFGNIELEIERVDVSDFENERDRKRVKLDLTGVALSDMLSGAGDLPLKSLLHASGRTELSAFDTRVHADYNVKAGDLSLQYSIKVPDLLSADTSIELKNLPDMESIASTAAQGMSGFGGGPLAMLGELENVEIGKSSFAVRDLGYFKRRSLIEQRYKYALDPMKGDAEKQRKTAFEADVERQQRSCEQEFGKLLPKAKDACEAWIELANGIGDGAKIAIAPERQVRVSDISRLFMSPEQAGPMIKRLQLEVDSL